MRRILDRERRGFAISLEIMLTYLLVAIVCSVTTYFAQAFEMERFFADVTASTCVMAARYGGSNSQAYRIQVGNDSTIEDTANRMLGFVADKSATSFAVVKPGGNGKYISVSGKPDSDGNVTVSLTYSIAAGAAKGPASLFRFESPVNQTFTLPSLMQDGKLIKR